MSTHKNIILCHIIYTCTYLSTKNIIIEPNRRILYPFLDQDPVHIFHFLDQSKFMLW
ncbi:hypothetical protein F383_32116 [Gossypium arboreum]|uniref:Uncharacterized protein n=1 Tax=Gossypium arboreum TaxID=29729 RepID=A0A0B0MUU3_GOSAR|nr:hypothetical protein F383_32116 [Gossypium arboreum]